MRSSSMCSNATSGRILSLPVEPSGSFLEQAGDSGARTEPCFEDSGGSLEILALLRVASVCLVLAIVRSGFHFRMSSNATDIRDECSRLMTLLSATSSSMEVFWLSGIGC